MTKLEQTINDIEEYIENCKPVLLSSNRIYVDKEQMEELLRELKSRLPSELIKYQRVVNNKEAILADAQSQADSIVSKAKAQTQELINEHEIMQRAFAEAQQIRDQAYAQAQEIVDRATEEANQMRRSSVQYSDEMLANLQRIIEHSIDSSRKKYDGLLLDLDKTLNVVISNRGELSAILNGNNNSEEEEQLPVAASNDNMMDDDNM